MLGDLGSVLGAAEPGSVDGAALRQAVVHDNVLGKRTTRTRLASWQRLNRLYGLSDKTPTRQMFFSLWEASPDARAQLALLRALERDDLLKVSAPWIVAQPAGQAVTPAAMATELTRLGVVYSEKTLRSISRNLLSSWSQVGWLTGKVAKRRAAVQWQPAAAAYLLHGAYLTGQRGAGLYDTPSAHLLALDPEQLDALAFAAFQERLLSYRRLGDVVEITFPGWEATEVRGSA